MRIAILILIALGSYQAWQQFKPDPRLQPIAEHDQVIMYSLTTCGYCVAKKKELDASGIAFTEVYIDRHPAKQQELNNKLAQAGYAARGYGTPILDVKGVMLVNNPAIKKIEEYL